MSSIAVFALSAVVIVDFAMDLSSSGTDCSMGRDHTMCKYNGPKSGCTPGKLTSDQRNEIIKQHNEYRSKVASGKEDRSPSDGKQPTAADMLRVQYDDGLAKVAQRWAEQCTFGHDKNRKDKRFSGVGQNAAWSWFSEASAKFSPKKGMDGWYNEVKDYDPNFVENFQFSDNIGHYTQVVWHDTYLIGCGYASASEKNGVAYYFICNYAPAGNMGNAKVYTIGDPCTKCPEGKTCSDSLCG